MCRYLQATRYLRSAIPDPFHLFAHEHLGCIVTGKESEGGCPRKEFPPESAGVMAREGTYTMTRLHAGVSHRIAWILFVRCMSFDHPSDWLAFWFIPLSGATVVVTVGGIVERLSVRDSGIEAREHLCLTVTFNHDIVDGAPAARFLKRFSELLTSSELLGDATASAAV
jgi:hypothetical protein